MSVKAEREFGTGMLFKAATVVYGLMVCDALLVGTNILLVLSPVLASLGGAVGGWLVLLASLSIGPSIVAAAYSCNRLIAGHDSGPARDFLRSLRTNAREALVVWLPFLAILALIAFNLAHPGTGGGSQGMRITLLVLFLLVSTTAINSLLLVSRFSFRTRDVFRLAIYCLGAQKRVSAGNCAVVFLLGFLAVSTSVALLLILAGAAIGVICLNSRSMLRFVEARFTSA